MPVDLELFDKDEVRRRTPLASVCVALGVHLNEEGWGPCPFHDDDNPSFHLYIDDHGIQRWGCFPCGLFGDCFDLIQRLEMTSFGMAIRRAAQISKEAPKSVRREQVQRNLDREAMEQYVTASRANASQPESFGLVAVAASLSQVPAPEIDKHLRELMWGVDEQANVVMPHYTSTGELTGTKMRSLDGTKWSFPGSRFPRLYGDFLPRKSRVILCEGETDLAHAYHQLPSPSDLSVRSLPTGAGTILDPWVEEIGSGLEVILALDADPAGRAATAKWISALEERPADVTVLPIPDGEDLRSCGIPITTLYAERQFIVA